MIKHVAQVIEAIGPENIEILDAIFSATRFPGGVPAQRFRADHQNWIAAIDQLESNTLLLERDRSTATNYTVKVFALPLLSVEEADMLLLDCDKIWPTLQSLYRELLSVHIPLQRIAEDAEIEIERLRILFAYMKDASGWWQGLSQDFPFGKNATVSLSEGVLTHASFYDIISEVYEWHYANARVHAPQWNDFLQRVDGNIKHDGFFSAADMSSRPDWYDELSSEMKAVIDELDQALRQGLVFLPAMGLRTLIDMVMMDKGHAEGPFVQRLENFVKDGWVTPKNKGILEVVLDAGHASAHRAYFPDSDDLKTCMDVVKQLLQTTYVLPSRAARLKANTPQRNS